MKFTSIKQTRFNTAKNTLTLIGFTVFLTILSLGSCGVADDTAPPGGGPTTFQQDIENAATVPDFTNTKSPLTREVLEPLEATAGATLEKRYVTESGAGSRDGSSWADAWAAVNLRNAITNINNATASRVYLVMVAGGTYKPDYSTTVTTTERAISFSMTNHVAIMGGFQTGGGWSRTGTTMFSGDIGTAGDSTDNSYHVFSHTSVPLESAHLYGVTITGGNANGSGVQSFGGGMANNRASPVLTEVVFSGNSATDGAGMFNDSSSPVLTRVVFSGNSATDGAGMYNDGSSPVLTNVTFNENTAGNQGGGMYNNDRSSPVLTEVMFSGNSANNGGGGMYNEGSPPVLTEVVFSGNSATDGGGMFNNGSSPVLTRVAFSGNTATGDGGGMYNNISSPVLTEVVFINNRAANGGAMWNISSVLVLKNTVYSGNTATGDGGGMYNSNAIPIIIGAVFRNNSAGNGGAMLNNNNGRAGGPFIVNSIFSGNNVTGSGGATGNGPDIAMNLGAGGNENIRIAGSVLGLGLAHPTNAIVGYGGGSALNINYHSLSNTAVNFGAEATLTINGMNFLYPTIQTGSSAINLGLYARRRIGGNHYFSEDRATWYIGFATTGGWGTAENLPANTEDLAATDIAGNARNARPDAGVHEVQ